MIGPNGAGKTTLLSILAGIRDPDSGTVSVPGRGRLGAAERGALPPPDRGREPAPVRPPRAASTTSTPRSSRCSSQTRLGERRDDQVGTLSGGNQQRVNIAIGLLSAPAVLLLDEPSTGLDPRQRERLWEFVLGLAGSGHDGDLLDPPPARGGALRRPPARARRRRARLRRHLGRASRRSRRTTEREDFEAAFVRFLARAGALTMRWLLLKDLQILRRSPLIVALLIAYPVALGVLIGFALSADNSKPRVAFLNEVPRDAAVPDRQRRRRDRPRASPATSSAPGSSASTSRRARRPSRRSRTVT